LAPKDRFNLVGLMPRDGTTAIPPGAIILDTETAAPVMDKAGHVTTAVYSANLEKPIALAMLTNGRQRMGEALWAHAPLEDRVVAVEVTQPVFIDPKGERLRA
jgi:sarcosine oxidase subunit alpha